MVECWTSELEACRSNRTFFAVGNCIPLETLITILPTSCIAQNPEWLFIRTSRHVIYLHCVNSLARSLLKNKYRTPCGSGWECRNEEFHLPTKRIRLSLITCLEVKCLNRNTSIHVDTENLPLIGNILRFHSLTRIIRRAEPISVPIALYQKFNQFYHPREDH